MLPAAVLFADLATALPHAHAVRTPAPPALDGRLDDEVWTNAPPNETFTQKFPSERAAPSERTTFRILYDDNAVYVGIDCEQKQHPIVRRLTRRDRIVEADRVAIAIDTRGEGTTAYELTVNASGVLADAIRFNDTEVDEDWDETWDARVAETDHGWSVEMKLPLRMLRFSSNGAQAWRLQVRRYLSALKEIDEWSLIPRDGGGEVSRYGVLDGVETLRIGAGIELRPFVLARVDRRDPGTETLGSGTALRGSAGVDLKWHPTGDLALDATINPDFAQVEADKLILNLTNYEIELPEKRLFFFEGRDLWKTPLPLLYTRRIGRVAPDAPALRPAEGLVDPTTPAPVLGAQKLVGRLAPGTSIATLTALTGTNEVLVRDASGNERTRPVEPRTLFSALRLKREAFGNGHVGLMMTAVTRGEQARDYERDAGLALCPTGERVTSGSRCFHDAYVGAVDTRWRSADGAWALTSQVVGSAIHEGPTRTLRDGTSIRPGDLGLGGEVKLAKEGGVPWVGDILYRGASAKLDFNDAGYMRRQNLHEVAANLEYRTLEPWFVTIETHSRFEFFARRNTDGLRLAEGYQINTQWKLPSFWELFTELHYRAAYFDDREIGDGAALERAGLLGLELEGKSDPRRRAALEWATQTQKVFGGFAFTGEALVTVRVVPELDFAVGPQAVVARGEPRFAGVDEAAGSLVFGRLDATNVGSTLRATYTFAPRLSLQAYGQLFLAGGHYYDFQRPRAPSRVIELGLLGPGAPPPQNPDFSEAAFLGNVVLRWEYALGSTLFLVYTRTQAPRIELLPGQRGTLDLGGVGRAPATDTFLVKLSHFFG